MKARANETNGLLPSKATPQCKALRCTARMQRQHGGLKEEEKTNTGRLYAEGPPMSKFQAQSATIKRVISAKNRPCGHYFETYHQHARPPEQNRAQRKLSKQNNGGWEVEVNCNQLLLLYCTCIAWLHRTSAPRERCIKKERNKKTKLIAWLWFCLSLKICSE